MRADHDRWADLVDEMYVLVQEEGHLFEALQGVRDHQGDGRLVEHGPWTAAECRSVLRAWLDEGWLELIVLGHGGAPDAVVAKPESAAILAQPEVWLYRTEIGMTALRQSEAGGVHDFDAWRRVADGARQGP